MVFGVELAPARAAPIEQRLANKLEREGADVSEWLRETAELYLKGELHRGEATDDESLQTPIISEIENCLKEIASLKGSITQTRQRIRSDLAQFFIALLCNPGLLPDNMTLSEADLNRLLACMFPDIKGGADA